jgi:SAM-dependent methyltransferase
MSATDAELTQRIQDVGPWTYDIPLGDGVWTRDERLPHTRLRRVVQIAHDLVGKPLGDCRVLDLGCLDGLFALEFGMHGADVVGMDIRQKNIDRCLVARDALHLDRIHFSVDDVRNLSVERYGSFDIVLCSGLLYHLDVPAVFDVIDQLYAVTTRLVIIDTHVSLSPRTAVHRAGRRYLGNYSREHGELETDETKLGRVLSSFGNDQSFVLSRESLVNYLARVGFSSVYEAFAPMHLNFGRPGIEHRNRCTLVGIKSERVPMQLSPSVNELEEDFPERSLSYPREQTTRELAHTTISRLGRSAYWRLRTTAKRLGV